MPLTKQSFWTTLGGDNQRTSRVESSFPSSPKAKAPLRAKGRIHASPVADLHQNIFIADMSGLVQAFSRKGARLWRKTLEDGVHATPAVHFETSQKTARLLIATVNGWLYCLNAANGEEHWKERIPSEGDYRILSDVLCLPKNKLVVVSSWGEKFTALNLEDGSQAFTWDAGSFPYAAASAAAEETIYSLRSRWSRTDPCGIALIQVNPSDGEAETAYFHELDRNQDVLSVLTAPVIDEKNNRLWFMVYEGRETLLYCLNRKDGEVEEIRRFEGHVTATPALMADGSLIIADMQGQVNALDAGGSPQYHYDTGADYLLSGPICDQQGNTFLGDVYGTIHCITSNGEGKPIVEDKRGFEGKGAFAGQNLLFPCVDGSIVVMG